MNSDMSLLQLEVKHAAQQVDVTAIAIPILRKVFEQDFTAVIKTSTRSDILTAYSAVLTTTIVEDDGIDPAIGGLLELQHQIPTPVTVYGAILHGTTERLFTSYTTDDFIPLPSQPSPQFLSPQNIQDAAVSAALKEHLKTYFADVLPFGLLRCLVGMVAAARKKIIAAVEEGCVRDTSGDTVHSESGNAFLQQWRLGLLPTMHVKEALQAAVSGGEIPVDAAALILSEVFPATDSTDACNSPTLLSFGASGPRHDIRLTNADCLGTQTASEPLVRVLGAPEPTPVVVLPDSHPVYDVFGLDCAALIPGPGLGFGTSQQLWLKYQDQSTLTVARDSGGLRIVVPSDTGPDNHTSHGLPAATPASPGEGLRAMTVEDSGGEEDDDPSRGLGQGVPPRAACSVPRYQLPLSGSEIHWQHTPRAAGTTGGDDYTAPVSPHSPHSGGSSQQLADCEAQGQEEDEWQECSLLPMGPGGRPLLVFRDSLSTSYDARVSPPTSAEPAIWAPTALVASVDIDAVLCVDVRPPPPASSSYSVDTGTANGSVLSPEALASAAAVAGQSVLTVAVLIRGRWADCGANNDWGAASDGDTEIGGEVGATAPHSIGGNSTTDMDSYNPFNEHNTQNPPSGANDAGSNTGSDNEDDGGDRSGEYIFSMKHFVCLLEVCGGAVHTRCIYEVTGMLADQAPLLVCGLWSECYRANDAAVGVTIQPMLLTGTNGLVGLLRVNQSMGNATTTDTSTTTTTINADIDAAHLRLSVNAQQLCRDNSVDVLEPVVPLVTHNYAAIITAVDYCHCSRLLATADSDGAVCIWRFYPGHPHLSPDSPSEPGDLGPSIASQPGRDPLRRCRGPGLHLACAPHLGDPPPPLVGSAPPRPRVTNLAWSPYDCRALVASYDYEVKLLMVPGVTLDGAKSQTDSDAHTRTLPPIHSSALDRAPVTAGAGIAVYLVEFAPATLQMWRVTNVRCDRTAAAAEAGMSSSNQACGLDICCWEHSLPTQKHHHAWAWGPARRRADIRGEGQAIGATGSAVDTLADTGTWSDVRASVCGGTGFASESHRFTCLLAAVHANIARADGSGSDRALLTALLEVFCAAFTQRPTVAFLAAVLERNADEVTSLVEKYLSPTGLLQLTAPGSAQGQPRAAAVVCGEEAFSQWLVGRASSDERRLGGCASKCTIAHTGTGMFTLNTADGHNRITALYLHYCANKSIAVEHESQEYLRIYGPQHLRKCSRGLREYTTDIRKIDETANIRGVFPVQLGYISGLQELYARRVGLCGPLPAELGELSELRVLSLGNNHISGRLPAALGRLRSIQRIVLHQNNLQGLVPPEIDKLGCIINLAGNPQLDFGADVPVRERAALGDLYQGTRGARWVNHTAWCDPAVPVSQWYKVGVLGSRVHSIVMSSNNMNGKLPASIATLSELRMIELATMAGLNGPIPTSLCGLLSLRRLCICRCSISGKIPPQIGDLAALEELQLFGNMLTGSIPDTIGKLVNLRLLSLGEYTGGNGFAAGPLPSCISRLRRLEALFMANCNLTGAIPPWLGCLTELRQLDMQRNMLVGSIPDDIGNCSNLLYLNLKDNEGLCGELPTRPLARLARLNRLSLVHCHFTITTETLAYLQAALPRCKVWV